MSQATTARPAVLRPAQLKSHDRGGGARTTPLVMPSLGADVFINGITEFAPGTAIPFHSHNCYESVVMISGNAYLDIEGEPTQELGPLDTTFLPAGLSHRFRNRSDTEPMKILWIYASPNATRTITATGETRPVAAEHAR